MTVSHPTAIQHGSVATLKIEPESVSIWTALGLSVLPNGRLPFSGLTEGELIPGTAMEMAGLRSSFFCGLIKMLA